MKKFNLDFIFKAWVQPTGCTKGVKQRPKLIFFWNMVMLHIKLKGITYTSTWVQLFCPKTPSTDPGVGSKSQNSTFSEHGHGAYKIKGNDECSNMQAHILSFHAPSTPGLGSKHYFLNVVMLYTKLIGMEQRTPCKHIFCPNRHPRSLRLGEKLKIFFSDSTCHVAYQIKGN